MLQWLVSLNALFTAWCTALYCCIVILLKPYSSAEINQILAHSCKKIIKNLKIEIHIIGNYHLIDGRPHIVMSNHTSIFDIIILFYIFAGNIRMITKKSLFRTPIIGQAMRKIGCISIDRKKPYQTLAKFKKPLDIFNFATPLWIAPEGTHSRDNAMLPLKRGGAWIAIQTEAVIIPLLMNGSNKVLPSKKLLPNLGKQIIVNFSPPIDSKSYNIRQSKKLLNDIELAFTAAHKSIEKIKDDH